MRNLIPILILPFLFISCSTQSEEHNTYIEHKPSFFDLRHGNWLENKWIRKPENLQMVHESFKKYGYDKLFKMISSSHSHILINDIYIKKDLNTLIDSLIISYGDSLSTKYYREFWQRRQMENNDSMVYHIIKDISDIRKTKVSYVVKPHVNDTLVDLLNIEFSKTSDPLVQIVNAEKLIEYEMHQSAYNYIYEGYFSESIHDIVRERNRARLIPSDSFTYPWIMDISK